MEYNGQGITYDEMGNPLSYLGYTFAWENIRNLATVTGNGQSISYTYDDVGIRTSKTVNGVKHEYVVEGSRILSEAYGNVFILYLYDEAGLPIGMAYRESSYAPNEFDKYYFTKNLQGDILNIYSEAGTRVASYTYDAWGNHTVTNYTSDNIGDINPFRYRSYYFDSETGFYYLNSRYYDPEIKRFISADSINYLGANGDMQAFNLYAYCSNNPVMFVDPSGEFWEFIAIAVVAVVAVIMLSSCSNDDLPNEVIYDVPVYDQGGSSLCWAYCQVMVESYHSGKNLTQEQADDRARELAIQENGETEWNDGDWPTNCKLIGRKVRKIENLRDMLVENEGPLYAYYTRSDGAHLVVVAGVDVEAGLVYVNNPWGYSGPQSFFDFKSDVLGNNYNPNRDYRLRQVYGTR